MVAILVALIIAGTVLILLRHGAVITIRHEQILPEVELIEVPEEEEEDDTPVNNFHDVIKATHSLFGGIDDGEEI